GAAWARPTAASDAAARTPHRPRPLHAARAGVPLRAARAHLPLRLQPVERAELADLAPDDALVLADDPRPGDAAGAVAVAEGGGPGNGGRDRPRRTRVVRRAPLPLLRARGDLVRARAPDRAARDHHRHGAQLVL